MRITGLVILAASVLGGCIFSEYDRSGRLRNISPEAMAALPRGIDPAFLVRDDNDCYVIVLEAEGSGVPLRNNAGVQVCDG